MRYSVGETRDFKCKLCGMKWLSYIENNDPCGNVSEDKDGTHNFDFSKPIKTDTDEKDSTPSTSTNTDEAVQQQGAQVHDSTSPASIN
jgi:hypothetical protein